MSHSDVLLPELAFCERIICLHDQEQAPSWWLALLSPDCPAFRPRLRLREAPLDGARKAVETAVAEGCRPYLFLPRLADQEAVYSVLEPNRGFARIWQLGRDDERMSELLQSPAPEIWAAQKSGATLVVPDLDYGKALDEVLGVCLDDFLADEESVPEILGPGRARYERVSRLNAFRILQVEVDRIAGEVLVRQLYVSGDPQGPRESCKLPIAITGEEQLHFNQEGLFRTDRSQESLINAICKWLAIEPIRPLLKQGGIVAGPGEASPAEVCKLLIRLEQRIRTVLKEQHRLNDFQAWMDALVARYFTGTPPRPTADKPLQWVIRALDEMVAEFNLSPVFELSRVHPQTLGSGPMGSETRQQADEKDLETDLAQIAAAYIRDGQRPDIPQSPIDTPRILGPGLSVYRRVYQRNPERLLEVEVDRIAGAITLRQYYLKAGPTDHVEPCDLPVAIPGAELLLFDQGTCRVDRAQDAQVAAVCEWLGTPPLLTFAQPAVAPSLALSQALTQSKARVLSELDQKKRRGQFLDWMVAWRKLYFAGTPLRPTAEVPLQWVIRALEEVIREFCLLDVLRARATPLPALGAGAMRGGVRKQEGKPDLEGLLGDVAEAFAPEGDE